MRGFVSDILILLRFFFYRNILISRHLISSGWLLGIFVSAGVKAISTLFPQPCSDAAHLPAVTTAARPGGAGPFDMAAGSGWYVNTCQRRLEGEQPQSRPRKLYTSEPAGRTCSGRRGAGISALIRGNRGDPPVTPACSRMEQTPRRDVSAALKSHQRNADGQKTEQPFLERHSENTRIG